MNISEEGATRLISERRGLGAASSIGAADMFDNFRNNKSKRYHVAAEERSKGITREDS
jgi:hypothetical protein